MVAQSIPSNECILFYLTLSPCQVEMRNMDTGDLTIFRVDSWFSASKGDRKICRDVVAIVKGKTQLRCKFQPFQKNRVPYHGINL